jgi:hypothetical protein
MLQFVLRDGFDACEEDVRESLAADAGFRAGKGVPHDQAIWRTRSNIESRAKRDKRGV